MLKKIRRWFKRNRIVTTPKDGRCPYCKKDLIARCGTITPNSPNGLTVCPEFHYVEHVDGEGHTWIDTDGGKPMKMQPNIINNKEEIL